MIHLEQCYARVNNLYFVKKYLGNELLENEKIIEKENGNITFKNLKVKEFYQKYAGEINSFKREKLHKIYDDLKLRVEFILNTPDNIHKFIVNGTKVEFIDYQNRENDLYIESSEALQIKDQFIRILDNREKEPYIKSVRYYALDSADISFVSTVNVLDKDKNGIYFVNNSNKEYVYVFEKENDL